MFCLCGGERLANLAKVWVSGYIMASEEVSTEVLPLL